MACYDPMPGQLIELNGKRKVVMLPRTRESEKNIALPCGKCIGCRLDKARDYALRCWHESLLHDQNCFITLTYSDENLPHASTLLPSHFQKFIRRLRKKTSDKIRFYGCGEYGSPEKTERPHYHSIIFGYDFPDKKLVHIRDGNRVYTSRVLASLWPYGTHEIGSVTYQSAGYVARYILKKQNGQYGSALYEETGRLPPFTRMSLRPGIGHDYYKKFRHDFFPNDYAVSPDGRKVAVPGYYRRLLERDDPALSETLRQARVEKAKDNPDNIPARLDARHKCKVSQSKRLTRQL